MRFVAAAKRVKTGKLPSPVYLSDDLTPDRKGIFNDGRRCKCQKLITDVWTTNGRIYVKQLNGGDSIIFFTLGLELVRENSFTLRYTERRTIICDELD